jgi:hypothetical protein
MDGRVVGAPQRRLVASPGHFVPVFSAPTGAGAGVEPGLLPWSGTTMTRARDVRPGDLVAVVWPWSLTIIMMVTATPRWRSRW